MRKVKILNVDITSIDEESILEYLMTRVVQGKEKVFITTPNPEIVTYAARHPEFRQKLNRSDIALPDGVGLLLAARILGVTLKSRISGVDFIEHLCVVSREKPMSMGFLGARRGVAEKAAKRLQQKYPWIKVAFVGEQWDTGKIDAVRYSKERTINKIDILFVAFGSPKQEEWIYENLPHLPVKAAMGVGGAFDYLSGEVTRAPKFVRAVGLEWLFRLIRQPWRWRRQLSLFTFLLLVLKERLQKK